MNKYARTPDSVLDLHGYTTAEAAVLLDETLVRGKHTHVRVITGKGTFRPTGPVLRTFVQTYLAGRGLRYAVSKIADGGEGAFEVYL